MRNLYDGLMRQHVSNTQRLQKTSQHIKSLALKEKLKHDMLILQPKLQELHDELLAYYKKKWGVKEFKFI